MRDAAGASERRELGVVAVHDVRGGEHRVRDQRDEAEQPAAIEQPQTKTFAQVRIVP